MNLGMEKFTFSFIQYLAKFNVFEINYITKYIEIVQSLFKNNSRKTKVDHNNLHFILEKWKGLSDLNFDEGLSRINSSDKVEIEFLKVDFMKMFERELNDANNEGLVKEINKLITTYQTQSAIEEKITDEERVDDNNIKPEAPMVNDKLYCLEGNKLKNFEEASKKTNSKDFEKDFVKKLDDEMKALNISKIHLYDNVIFLKIFLELFLENEHLRLQYIIKVF